MHNGWEEAQSEVTSLPVSQSLNSRKPPAALAPATDYFDLQSTIRNARREEALPVAQCELQLCLRGGKSLFGIYTQFQEEPLHTRSTTLLNTYLHTYSSVYTFNWKRVRERERERGDFNGGQGWLGNWNDSIWLCKNQSLCRTQRTLASNNPQPPFDPPCTKAEKYQCPSLVGYLPTESSPAMRVNHSNRNCSVGCGVWVSRDEKASDNANKRSH